MDHALKARLIGAAVLVALAVLFIPELLSGRKPAVPVTAQADSARGTRTFTIELAGAAGNSSVTQDKPSPTPAAMPVPKSEPAVAPSVAAVERAVTGPAAPATSTESQRDAAVTPEPEPAPAQVIPARGGWAVQVGAFGSAEAANKLVGQLQSADFAAYVAPVSRSGKTLHRVRVGPVTARAGAEALVPALKARGLPATVVAND
jgi:DedD protein